ncbi:polysaccharide biosynthesis protein [Planctomicrobium sp. SH664]|uniref:polysaccharide biosynthesis protein n=1 Tax=Planctomicrobium sp. SH664 TaxID=3448125 RepID=UPI003F5B9AFB
MRHRLAAILPMYLALQGLAYVLAYVVRFEFQPTRERLELMWGTLPLVMLIKVNCATLFNEFRRSFRFVSVNDLIGLAGSTSVGLVALWVLNFFLDGDLFIPRSVICLDALLSIMLLGGMRLVYRTVFEVLRPKLNRTGRKRTLIFGVNQPSVGILRMLSAISPREQPYQPVAFVSRDQNSNQCLINGLKVHRISEQNDLKTICELTKAQNLLIPGDTPGRIVRELLHECAEQGVNVFVIPAVGDLMDGRFKLTVCDVTVSDLLRRDPNQLDMDSIKDYVTGKRVLVTGGAGSIGSELCRQIAALQPEMLIVFDQSEFGTFSIEQEFAEKDLGSVQMHYIVGDVVDEQTLTQVVEELRPQLIFHAAAYKHVPLMEDNPQAAVLNNILGTKTVADVASRCGVERFVLISTDKAVRPTSVMGASKLIAEKYVQGLSRTSKTRFITVRFGNVLNSMGSVVPTFRRQIEQGGPITVTHPEMKRFFMTIPEAVQLVLQAGAIGPTGGVLILDMGEPVKIVDLAKDMILLSGLRYPDDIEIVFTGMRPGEKLYEELFYPAESGSAKIHEKIYCGGGQEIPPMPLILADVRKLEEAAATGREETLAMFREVVARYSDSEWTPARLSRAA